MKAVLIWLAVPMILAGCQKKVDMTLARQDLIDTDRQFSRLSVEKGRYAAFDAYMADSATMYRNNEHPFIGRAVIRENLSKATGGTLKWEPTSADVARSGDLGYTLGKYTFSYADTSGQQYSVDGYYVTIWKKQPDGNWRFVFDSGIQAPAP
jgi:ketosteroid isomerase-like protein